MDERDYYLAFSNSPNIGPGRLDSLLKNLGSLDKIWKSTSEEFMIDGIGQKLYDGFDDFRKSFDIQSYKKFLEQKKIWYITCIDKDYPKEFKKLDRRPIVIFGKGDRSCLATKNKFGVVGTRKVTSYGKEVTENLVTTLTNYGFTIVSGMALGVDGIAHLSCLDSGGKTIAVLGNGVDLPYPRENQSLYAKILEKGGAIISEYPAGAPPTKGSFLSRNRIVAALSLGILVTEAGQDSGSLVTAEIAKSLGKPIFSVPGPITSRLSDGTTKLLKDGGVLVSSARDITDALQVKTQSAGWRTNLKTTTEKFKSLNLSLEELKICKLLENESFAIDDIFAKTKIPIQKLSVILSEMEMKGIVERRQGEFGIRN